jgi:hypothetical protein
MDKILRTAVTASAIAIAALSLTLPAQAGPRSAVGAGLVGFGIGAILGSMMGPPEAYFGPPPPDYYGPVDYGPPDYDGPVGYGPPDSYRPRGYYGPPGSYRPRSYGPPPAPDRYGDRSYPRPNTPPLAAARERRPAPARTATAKAGPAAAPVKPDPDARFKAVQAKAKRVGVERLTQKDIEGLSPEQIKQLRGY